MRTRWASVVARPATLTVALIVISCIVSGVTSLGRDLHRIEWMMFGGTSMQWVQKDLEQRLRDTLGLPQTKRSFRFDQPGSEEIRSGQVWRLVTPIFVHFDLLHLVFNMMWLLSFGGAIERRRGPLALAGIVLFSAVVSNVAQFLWSGPSFGGMSGVVYALFGYVWIKSLTQPQSGFAIRKETVTLLIAVLLLCMTGWLGPVANTAHVMGLISGMVLAHAPYSWSKLRRAMRESS